VLYELPDPAQTLMELRMTSLLPAEAVAELEQHLGPRFSALSELERLALVTAVTEGMVNHARLREICAEHPADITKMFALLVRSRLLVSDGAGRGTVYFVPWHVDGQGLLFDGISLRPSEAASTPIPAASALPQELSALPQELSALPQELGALPQELGAPLWVEIADVPAEEFSKLGEIAVSIRIRKRSAPDEMRETVRQLCRGRYVGVRVLATLLNRNAADLVRRVLSPMVTDGLLRRAFPRPSDPRQAYIGTQSPADAEDEKDKN